MTASRDRVRALLAAAAFWLVAVSGCGYTVGHSFDVPVETVAVPVFDNETYRRGLEFQLTEAIHREIQTRTPFRLVTDADAADTRLTGTIVSARKSSITQTPFGDPRQLEFQLLANVTWEDLRTGKVLAEYQIPVTAKPRSVITQKIFSPTAGQSRASAERKAINRMARKIVDLMEAPW